MNVSNMSAYAAKINLKLLNDIIIFVVNAAKASYAQKQDLRTKCIFPLTDNQAAASAMQREYGFLYLGELLERYEERFGMTPPDRRAIALALGYTREIATPEMFVGSQKGDFIQAVRRHADTEHDIYLTGALYLIHRKECTAVVLEDHLKKWTYTKTEELIFAMSLFPDREQAHGEDQQPTAGSAWKGAYPSHFRQHRHFQLRLCHAVPIEKANEGQAHGSAPRSVVSAGVLRQGGKQAPRLAAGTWLHPH